MKQEKSLIQLGNERRGIKKIINSVFELIKSKVDKDYMLSVDSPEFLKQNRNLILKTIKRNVDYLDQVSDDILLDELLQQQLPTNGIIYTAFKRGYILGKSSSDILKSEKAKSAIIQYLEMQKGFNQRDNLFSRSDSDSQYRITHLLENLDESLMLDINFREQLLDLAIEKGYKITPSSPEYLKNNDRLAENYYVFLIN